ncbi:MAG: hypothetical protein IJE07_06935 [Clostridia bacterium]|nr:hypothetical protein [Clostridia bacterium]
MTTDLTIREIFDRITQLHDQLASSALSLNELRHSLDSALCNEVDESAEIVENVTNVFIHREQTLRSLLDMYFVMYNDLKNT